MSFDSLLIDTMDVKTQTVAQDALKSITVTPATVVSGWPCRIEALSGRERVMFGERGTEVTHKVFCRVPSPAVQEKDKLTISSVDYQVHFVNPIKGRLGVDHLEIIVQELRHG